MIDDAVRKRYSVGTWLGRCRYELYEDRVRMRGSAVFGSNFDVSVRLETLDPEPFRVWPRSTGFFAIVAGITLAIVSVLAFVSNRFVHLSDGTLTFSLLGILVIGLAVGVFLTRRREVTAFRLRTGGLAVAIERSARSEAEYAAFIAAVSSACRRAEDALRPDAPDVN